MAHVGEQRTILFKNRLPIVSVKLRIVKILALDAPRLAINLFPLGARIYTHFELGDVKRSITNLNRDRAIGGHDPPTGSTAGARLIKKFLFVVRERIRTKAFEERRGRALFELISLQPERWWRGRSRQDWLSVGETSRGARGEIGIITGRYVHGNYSLPYSFKVDANIYRARSGGCRLRSRLCAIFARRRSWRFIAGLGQERRRFARAKYREVDRATHRTIDRTHLQPAGAWTIIGAGEEVEVLTSGVEGGRNRISHAVTELMAFLLGQRIDKDRSQMTGQIL